MPPDHTISPCKCKPRSVKPYAHIPRPKTGKSNKVKNAPKTSTFSNTPSQRNNLTLHDWLHVRNWYDNNQLVSQAETVSHFKNLPDNALLFTQGMLSRHLTKKGREQDDTRLASTPLALSSKRARIVTRLDVEEALQLWVQHMEQKRETVTGPILVEKCAQFEDALKVPECKRLQSDGWVQKFLRTWVQNATKYNQITYSMTRYNLKEYRRHGEAASVNLKAVKREQVRVAKRLEKYPPKDRLNTDESGLFGL